MIVLVTRPMDQGLALAERLRQRGHQAILLPLLLIEPIAEGVAELPRALEGAQAALFTSANGVRAFAAATSRRDIRVLAVGGQTAAAAGEAGFAGVESAGGDVASLADLAAERLRPEAGPLVHGAGAATAGDLVGALEKRGFEVRRVALYRAEPASEIAPETAAAIRARRIDAALFYSPRSAAIFATLIRAANLEGSLRGATALALSSAVATALAALPWARVLTAETPSDAAMLAALDLVAAPEGVRSSAETMSNPEIIPPGSPKEPGAPTSAPVMREPKNRWIGAGLGLALLLSVGALAGVAYLWLEPHSDEAAAATAQKLNSAEATIAALRSRVDAAEGAAARQAALEKRLATLEQRIGEASTASSEAARQAQALTDKLAGLEQQVAKLADDSGALAALQTATKSLETETQSLAQKIDAQANALAALAAEKQQASSSDEAALLVSLQQLRLTLASASPFASPLHTAEALAQQHADLLQQLQGFDAHAGTGIPTLAQLTERFEAMADRVLEAAPPSRGGDWLKSVGDYLMRFFNVRRDSGGSASENALGAAQAALKSGDLSGAIASLKRLQGAPADAASRWLADAEAREDAERRLAAIDDTVQRELMGGAATKAKP